MNFKTAQSQNQDSVFVRDSNQVLLNKRLAYHKMSCFPEFENLVYFDVVYTF